MSSLEHYGVKGMQWGVRKDRSDRHEGFGKRSSRRINRRVAKGYGLEEAKRMERQLRTAKRVAMAVYGAWAVKQIFTKVIPTIGGYVAGARFAAAGARATANMFADSHGLTPYSAINLTFNAAKNVWE